MTGEKGNQELQRADEMGRDAKQRLALAQIETDQPEVAGRQVAQAAMNQARRCGSRAAAEVIPFKQPDREAAPRRVPGNAGPDDAATDDDDI